MLVCGSLLACLVVVLAEILRAGCCCSVLLLKFFGSGSDTKGSALGGDVVVFGTGLWLCLNCISGGSLRGLMRE